MTKEGITKVIVRAMYMVSIEWWMTFFTLSCNNTPKPNNTEDTRLYTNHLMESSYFEYCIKEPARQITKEATLARDVPHSYILAIGMQRQSIRIDGPIIFVKESERAKKPYEMHVVAILNANMNLYEASNSKKEMLTFLPCLYL